MPPSHASCSLKHTSNQESVHFGFQRAPLKLSDSKLALVSYMEAWWWIASTAVVVAAGFLLLKKFSAAPTRSFLKEIPPGSSGLPVIGETLQFILSWTSFIESRQKRYGDIFRSSLLGSSTIVSSKFELNKFILRHEGTYFAPSYPKSLFNMGGGLNNPMIGGSLHRRARGVLQTAILRQMHPAGSLVADIDRNTLEKLNTWAGKVVHASDESRVLAVSNAIKLALDSLLKQDEVQSLQQDIIAMSESLYSAPLAFPGTTYSKALEARKRSFAMLKSLFKAQRHTEQPCMAALMFGDGAEPLFTQDEAANLVIGVLIGGGESTHQTMSMALKVLYEQDDVLQELKKEHFEILRNKHQGEALTLADYKSMIFTQHVICEILRLSTHVFSREALQDVHFEGYLIPKGWKVMLNGGPNHVNPVFFPDPHKFNPWRWKDGNASSEERFMPFGGGKRICPGRELGMLEISIFIHHLVTKFSWKPAGEIELLNQPVVRFKNGFPIKVELLHNQ